MSRIATILTAAAIIILSAMPSLSQNMPEMKRPAPIKPSVSAKQPIQRQPVQKTMTEARTEGNISGTVDPEKQMTRKQVDAEVSKALREGGITLNFDNIDIKTITKIMADVTGKTIILDGSVNGSLTILSSRKVSIQEAWNLYLSALEAAGYGAVAKNGSYKIIELSKSRRENSTYAGTERIKPRPGFVTALVLLTNADAEIMKTSLMPLVPGPGVISSYQPSNAVIITDTSDNVSRITKIARQLDDKYRGSSIRVFQPKYIRVNELANALTSVYQSSGNNTSSSHQQVKIAAYEPTNTLIVMAPMKDFLQIESAINEIDSEDRVIKSDERFFKVYYLKNATAEDVAKSISSLLEEKKKLITEIKKEQKGTAAAKEPDTYVSTKVAHDTATNSLIFYVTEREYNDIVPMIEMLDAPQKQILISAIIAETQLSNSLDAGIAWQAVANPGVIATFQGGNTTEALFNSLASGGFVAGGIGSESVELKSGDNTIKIPKLYAVIKALETKGNFNLLSTPRIITHDHQEAKLSATKTYPYATGVKYDYNNNPIINYKEKDVGLDLSVTPHVGQNDQVKLALKLKLSDFVEWISQGTGSSEVKIPVTTERSVDNTVTLHNGETIVIGGLIDENTTEHIKQVPLLSKLPLIGGLFKDKSVSKASRTLFVFITPYIITNPQEMKFISDKYGRALIKEKPSHQSSESEERNNDSSDEKGQ